MTSKWKTICIIAAILIFLVLMAYFGLSDFNSEKIKICPEAWYDNKMPGSNSDEYLIVDGKRAELRDYDIEWIKANCEIKEPQPVY